MRSYKHSNLTMLKTLPTIHIDIDFSGSYVLKARDVTEIGI